MNEYNCAYIEFSVSIFVISNECNKGIGIFIWYMCVLAYSLYFKFIILDEYVNEVAKKCDLPI